MQRQFNRRDFLKSVGLGAVTIGAVGCTGVTNLYSGKRNGSKQPNVILVITDDQGYGDLSCHGNPVLQTPNMDILHSQSTRLTNFHVSPCCAPTRAALMTGRYNTRTGVWHTVMGLSIPRKDEVMMGDVFSSSGYRTGMFGKWHLGDNYPYRPEDRGFEEVLMHGGGGVGQTPDYWGNNYFDDTYRHNGQFKKFPGYCADVWFDGAMDFIEANKERPFFCYLTTNTPHSPAHVAEKYSKPYEDKDVIAPKIYGMIANLDENIGRLLEKLKKLSLEENTILIFMTDNGTGAGYNNATGKGYNAGMRGTKGSQYDGGHRVPFFIRWPGGGLEAGRDIGRLTAHIDVLPTLIELCGLKRPREVSFDGDSLAPLLMSVAGNWPERTLVVDNQWKLDSEELLKWNQSAVMTDRWRLIDGKELYDINSDPGQQNDIADSHPKVVKKLRAAYEDWWVDVSKGSDEYVALVIGADQENPTRLNCMDWHGCGELPPWNQPHIRKGLAVNGFWAVEVARDGEYELELRRWPEELGLAITKAIPGGKAISATKARVKIADIDMTKPVGEDTAAVTFRVQLKAGKGCLQTWFTDDKGVSRGAYYVYVKRLV